MATLNATYHADNGPVKGLVLRYLQGADQGKANIGVFSDGNDGSGLSVGFTVLNGVHVGNGEVGTYSPA